MSNEIYKDCGNLSRGIKVRSDREKEGLNIKERIVYSMGKRQTVNTFIFLIMFVGAILSLLILILSRNFYSLLIFSFFVISAFIIGTFRRKIYRIL